MLVFIDRWNLPYTGPGYSNSSNLDIQSQGNIDILVPRKKVKFNRGLGQILSNFFPSKNMQLELTKYCRAFTPR